MNVMTLEGLYQRAKSLKEIEYVLVVAHHQLMVLNVQEAPVANKKGCEALFWDIISRTVQRL